MRGVNLNPRPYVRCGAIVPDIGRPTHRYF